MIYVYVIRSNKDGRFYVGMSQNVEIRILEHNSGRVKSTKGYVPWRIFFHEAFPDRESARKREKYLKSGFGKKWIKEKYNRSHSSAG